MQPPRGPKAITEAWVRPRFIEGAAWGCGARAGWWEAGRDPAARGRPGRPLLRRAQPPSPGARLPSLPAPARTLARGARPQWPRRTARSRQDPVRDPRGPLPFPGSRSPGRQEAEPARQSRPPSPRARLRRGSDSARGSAMEPPRAALTRPGAPDAQHELHCAGVEAPPLEVGGGGADGAVTLGTAPSPSANKNGGFARRRGSPGPCLPRGGAQVRTGREGF